MTNTRKFIFSVIIICLILFGYNPFAPFRDASEILSTSYTTLETGIYRQGNGIYVIKTLTRMPDMKADMVKWWFVDYMKTTEHYKRWHPTAHIWMDWENKIPGGIIGSSHLVHEYIGSDLHKLRIQFIHPSEFLDDYKPSEERFDLCARVGDLTQPINFTTMCHIVRNTQWGAEMRSTFWLGHVSKREGNNQINSIEGVIGNTALARFLLIDESLAKNLMIHAIEEMGTLAAFLPDLYHKENNNAVENTDKLTNESTDKLTHLDQVNP